MDTNQNIDPNVLPQQEQLDTIVEQVNTIMPIQPYLRAMLIEGSIQGVSVPIAASYQVEQGVVNILQQNKEYSYLPIAPLKRKKSKKAQKIAEGQQVHYRKRTAPDIVELTPMPQGNGDIEEDMEIRPDMTPEERQHAQAHNNENSRRREITLKRKNNISARRGRERRSNRAQLLAEDKAQALAERNFWKARAFGLGAGAFEWDSMPWDQRDDYVADFRVDIDSLLGK